MASKIATNMLEADFLSSAKRDMGFAATPTDLRSAFVLARIRDSAGGRSGMMLEKVGVRGGASGQMGTCDSWA